MARTLSYILCLILGTFISGCERIVDVDFSGYTSDAIVFEGIVTNERPPYFFHLTRPSAVSAGEYDYAGIEDAVIIITDVTDGIRDTLQYVPPRFEGYDVYYNYYNYDTKRKEETSGFSLDRKSVV